MELKPRLVSVYFGGNAQYPRMARVLEHTARKYCPGWDVAVAEVHTKELRSALGNISHARNAEKAVEWERIVRESEDGTRLLLVDADTFVTGNLDPLWAHEFDVMITTKQSRFPFNSGVVGVRVSDRARRFFDEWTREALRFLRLSAEHGEWRRKFGGLHQAALGALLEGGQEERLGLTVARLPCEEWNCEDYCWDKFDPSRTKIVHVKSALRLAVFHLGAGAAMRHTRTLADLWRAAERESGGPPRA